eukprot:TRINITY_DN7939_c0_g1_i1.p1 TRINITY_DN7939_c0_g1~~TRINITY_DN7939_c0_g1_i1.p1  ORF type:complete len:803 (+),score=112.22 TRINITY_DN7939_c0_g1_i1:64-2472(+)
MASALCEVESGSLPEALQRTCGPTHKFSRDGLVLRVRYAPPLESGPPAAVLYVLDGEPELFALVATHIFGRAGCNLPLRRVAVVGVAHHLSSYSSHEADLKELRRRDFLSAPPAGEVGGFLELLCASVVSQAEQHLGCKGILRSSHRAILCCSESSSAVMRLLLRRRGTFDKFVFGWPFADEGVTVLAREAAATEGLGPDIAALFVSGGADAEGSGFVSSNAETRLARALRRAGSMKLTELRVLATGSEELAPCLASYALSWLVEEWQDVENTAEINAVETGRPDDHAYETSSAPTENPSPRASVSSTPPATLPRRPTSPSRHNKLPETKPVVPLSDSSVMTAAPCPMSSAERSKLLAAFSHPDFCRTDASAGGAPYPHQACCHGRAATSAEMQSYTGTLPASSTQPCPQQMPAIMESRFFQGNNVLVASAEPVVSRQVLGGLSSTQQQQQQQQLQHQATNSGVVMANAHQAAHASFAAATACEDSHSPYTQCAAQVQSPGRQAMCGLPPRAQSFAVGCTPVVVHSTSPGAHVVSSADRSFAASCQMRPARASQTNGNVVRTYSSAMPPQPPSQPSPDEVVQVLPRKSQSFAIQSQPQAVQANHNKIVPALPHGGHGFVVQGQIQSSHMATSAAASLPPRAQSFACQMQPKVSQGNAQCAVPSYTANGARGFAAQPLRQFPQVMQGAAPPRGNSFAMQAQPQAVNASCYVVAPPRAQSFSTQHQQALHSHHCGTATPQHHGAPLLPRPVQNPVHLVASLGPDHGTAGPMHADGGDARLQAMQRAVRESGVASSCAAHRVMPT